MAKPDFHKNHTLPGAQVTPKDARPSDPLPKVIGTYSVENLYREGGMCLLYLATHPVTKDPVIIKTLKPHLRGNQEIIRKFNNEAKILKLADHPNIVSVYDYEEWEGGLYIALEFIQGESLHSVIENNPVSLRRAVEIILEIAYALCHLHTLGVIHRDLKPENILVTDQNTIKLIDLGVAQMLSEAEQKPGPPARPPLLVGTPIYMSPEQHTNPDLVSYASDIYSLGIIAYELVLGKLSHGQIHLALMPKGLQKIIAKTLQPRPEDRYHDVVDFITALSGYLNSASVEKERKSADLLSELSEHLQQAQAVLLPSQPPQWPEVDIGVSHYKGVGIGGIYYDFFALPDGNYGVVMAEPSAKGVEGVLYTAVLRGMVRTLCRLTTQPANLITFLNDLIVRDATNKVFWLSYLLLSSRTNQLYFTSCGPSKLWLLPHDGTAPRKIEADNPALGIKLFSEFTETCIPWNIGDLLFLHSTTVCNPNTDVDVAMDEASFAESLRTFSDLPTQKHAEAILRKATATERPQLERRLLCLVGLRRLR